MIVSALILGASMAVVDVDDDLDRIRAWIRQGRHADAAAMLAVLPGDLTGDQGALAELLRGNLAFESRRFEAAAAHYGRASGQDGPIGQAARDNLDRVEGERTRGVELSDRLSALKTTLAATIAAVGALAWVLGRSRT